MKEENTIKTIKGFDHELKCRDKQYEVGKTYEEQGKIKVCKHGMHAISTDVSPLSVFDYYPPSVDGKPSRYCEVEASGDIASDGNKIAASKLTVGAEIGIPGLVKAHVEWVRQHITNEHNAEPGKPAVAGDCGSAAAGYSGSAAAGDCGSAAAGDCGSAAAGYSGSAAAGYSGSAAAGDCGSAAAGDCGSAAAGYSGSAAAGYRGSAVSRGSSAVGENGVAVARGNGVKVKGGMGALLVIAEEYRGVYDIKDWKAAIVDDETIKADTWYTVENGEWKEVTEN